MTSNGAVIVGAGRVGTALALRLLAAHHPVDALVTRSAASRDRAAALVPSVPQVGPDSDVLVSAGTVLLCVADDDLPAVVELLAGRLQPGRLVAHTSGRHGLGVLSGLAADRAAIHPAMTFTGGPGDVADLDGIAYGVTAEASALAAATRLVSRLGGTVELVPDEQRAAYHAALSHAANHLVTLIADAADLLRAAGVSDTSRLLAPITAAALRNSLATDPATGLPQGDTALTGPVVRGDAGTVAAHLVALSGSPAEAAYRAMATRTAQRAAASGRLPQPAAQVILDLLQTGGPAS
jgi:predicted short-subunit dehydrogenase-like oxidoreductase (DUF2520 family)